MYTRNIAVRCIKYAYGTRESLANVKYLFIMYGLESKRCKKLVLGPSKKFIIDIPTRACALPC